MKGKNTFTESELEKQIQEVGLGTIIKQCDLNSLLTENLLLKEEILPTILNRHFQVCIYCAGEYGLKTYFILKNSGVKVDLFCDRDKAKQGVLLDGIECIGYERLQAMDKKDLIVFICIENTGKLEWSFRQDGFPYVYSMRTILDAQNRGLLNSYSQYDMGSYMQEDRIQKIDQFREDFIRVYYEKSHILGRYDINDSFEQELLQVLLNIDRR